MAFKSVCSSTDTWPDAAGVVLCTMSDSEPPKPPPLPRPVRLVPRASVLQADVLDRLGQMHEALEARSANLDARLQAEALQRDAMDRRIAAFHGELALLRGAVTGDSGPPSQPPPEPKPKTAVGKAAGGALAGLKYGSYVLLALTVAAKIATVLVPELAAPLNELLKLLGAP
jgi:hypothetical protein